MDDEKTRLRLKRSSSISSNLSVISGSKLDDFSSKVSFSIIFYQRFPSVHLSDSNENLDGVALVLKMLATFKYLILLDTIFTVLNFCASHKMHRSVGTNPDNR